MSTNAPRSLAELVADPDGTLKQMRAQGAAGATDVGPMFVQHAAVRALGQQDDKLRPAFSQLLEQFGVSSGTFYEWMKISPLDMDGEQHAIWRRLMSRTFTPRSVEKLKPFLQQETHRLLDECIPKRSFDFVDEYARKLPAAGLCELIGVPHQDRARFAGWADTVGLGFNVIMLPMRIAEIDAALEQLLAYADELVTQRRAEPKDDLVTRIAQAFDEEAGLDEQMIRGSIAGLVFAGHETTKNQLGWMIAVLAQHPDEWDRIAADPTRAKNAIEEVLRYRSTAANFGRLALQDVEIGGELIPKGTNVIASIWSANRDEKEFPFPDQFRVDDNRSGVHVAFGQGAHHCLGAALARAELQESLIALTQRVHCPTVEEGAEYLPPIGINGPIKLPVTVRAR